MLSLGDGDRVVGAAVVDDHQLPFVLRALTCESVELVLEQLPAVPYAKDDGQSREFLGSSAHEDFDTVGKRSP